MLVSDASLAPDGRPTLDKLDSIRTLLAAVDGGSLSAASRALGMPLPTVSRKVSELEAHLRTQLVVRTSRKLLLTDAGEAFLRASRRILEELEEAERAAAGEYRAPRGELLIAAPIMFGKIHILPIVTDFLKAYPEVDIRLVMADSVMDLIDNHIDVAARLGRLPDSGLVATSVGEVRWMTCASPDYVARRGLPQAPADLAKHDCLALEGLTPSRAWSFGREGHGAQVAIRPRLSVNTADALIEAACAGLGVARITSYQAAAALGEGRLVTFLRDHQPEVVPVHLVHTGPSMLPLKLRAFLDFASPRLRQALSALPS